MFLKFFLRKNEGDGIIFQKCSVHLHETNIHQMIDITELRRLNSLEHIVVTEHASIRLNSRGISIYDVQKIIDEGEIIRQYEEDKPFESCLVLGLSIQGKAMHAVVSHDTEFIYLITAYYPSTTIWETDFKTKKIQL